MNYIKLYENFGSERCKRINVTEFFEYMEQYKRQKFSTNEIEFIENLLPKLGLYREDIRYRLECEHFIEGKTKNFSENKILKNIHRLEITKLGDEWFLVSFAVILRGAAHGGCCLYSVDGLDAMNELYDIAVDIGRQCEENNLYVPEG